MKEGVLRILLVRHGETDWNKAGRFQGRTNVGLNEKGKAQAKALGVALRQEPLKAIYSSPISRAVETARAINRSHKVPLVRHEGLMEMDLGDFEGLLGTDLNKEHPEFLRKWREDPTSVRMPHGEALQEVQERAWAVVQEIVETHHEGTVLLCAHNFVIRTILCKVLGMPMSDFRRFRLSVGAISIIEMRSERYSVVCINDTCHLEAIAGPS
jgi:probable phosphoglycerate mutase